MWNVLHTLQLEQNDNRRFLNYNTFHMKHYIHWFFKNKEQNGWLNDCPKINKSA